MFSLDLFFITLFYACLPHTANIAAPINAAAVTIKTQQEPFINNCIHHVTKTLNKGNLSLRIGCIKKQETP